MFCTDCYCCVCLVIIDCDQCMCAGQEVEVDLEKDVLTVLESGKQYALKSIGEVWAKICALALCLNAPGVPCGV